MNKFEVGMKVLCTDDTYSRGKLPIKRGEEYIITSVKEATCCKALLISIGIGSTALEQHCTVCDGTFYADVEWFFRASRFIPAEEFQQVTYTKIIEQIPVGVN